MDKFVKELMLAVLEYGDYSYAISELLEKHYGINFDVNNYHYRPIPNGRLYGQSNPLISSIYSEAIQKQLEDTEKMLKLLREHNNG